MDFFNLKLSKMSSLALTDSFEYLCYGLIAIINIFTLTVWGSTLVVRIWRLQTSDSVNWMISKYIFDTKIYGVFNFLMQ